MGFGKIGFPVSPNHQSTLLLLLIFSTDTPEPDKMVLLGDLAFVLNAN